jgi:hypothetical protein
MRVPIFKVKADKQSGEERDIFRRIGLVWEGVCAMMNGRSVRESVPDTR